MGIPVALWLLKVLVISGGLLGAYAAVAHHHYARGWAEHEAEVAATIVAKNDQLDRLNARISHQILIASVDRQRAVEDAIEAERRARASDPVPWCTAVAAPEKAQRPACGIAPATRARLNLLK